jgi:hypothetical protein
MATTPSGMPGSRYHAGLRAKTLAWQHASTPHSASTAMIRSISTPALTVTAILAALGSGACGDEATYTPDACPPLNTYDIRELYAEENQSDREIANRRAGVEEEVREAAEDGCVTAPTDQDPLPSE